MTTKEMIETLRYKANNIKAKIEPEFFNEVADRLEILKELQKRKFTIEDLQEYMKFEDELVRNNFTFNSVLETREKQVAKKPKVLINDKDVKVGCVTFRKGVKTYKCICGCHVTLSHDYCYNCGQKLDWSGLNANKRNL